MDAVFGAGKCVWLSSSCCSW